MQGLYFGLAFSGCRGSRTTREGNATTVRIKIGDVSVCNVIPPVLTHAGLRSSSAPPPTTTPRVRKPMPALEVFENERYQPPIGTQGGWGSTYPGHLLPTDRARYSNEAGDMGFNRELEEIEPDPGCEFQGGWRLDRSYTQMDTAGWSYGMDFWVLNEKLRKNASLGKATAACFTRRRKWVRAQFGDEEETTSGAEDWASILNEGIPASAADSAVQGLSETELQELAHGLEDDDVTSITSASSRGSSSTSSTYENSR